jgi:hypothetical protein
LTVSVMPLRFMIPEEKVTVRIWEQDSAELFTRFLSDTVMAIDADWVVRLAIKFSPLFGQ